VLSRDPEAVIAGSANSDLSIWTRFDSLAATRTGNLLAVDAPHLARASTRLDDAATSLCAVIDHARQRLPGPL
jgi:ABC-type Fe2+-enterobactin transport system substrate-binding protein